MLKSFAFHPINLPLSENCLLQPKFGRFFCAVVLTLCGWRHTHPVDQASIAMLL